MYTLRFKTCPVLGPPHFPPQGPEGPRKKKSHWNQSKWRQRESRKTTTTQRLGSWARSRPCCQKRHTTTSTLWARGPERAAGFSPVLEHPWSLDPRPLPARTRGWGTSPEGTALPTAEPGEGHGCRHSSHPARRPEREPRDRSYRSHPHTHPSCGPARPPAPHRGRPKSHREPRKRPWGAGRERGADPRAHTGR